MLPQTIKNLIDEFAQLPGVGPRQAARFVFYLLKQPRTKLNKFVKNITEAEHKLHQCPTCFSFTESAKFCPICADKNRQQNYLCLIEKETDIDKIEKTKKYSGFYHILRQGKDLHLKELAQRIKKTPVLEEIIIATSATTVGDSLALYLAKFLRELKLPAKRAKLKITRLGRGLSTGSEIEYVDEETLEEAFISRK